jgi:hypothetical protein
MSQSLAERVVLALKASWIIGKGKGDGEFSVKNAQALPIRNTDVPQLGHTPLMAAFPFLSVTF